MKVKFKGAAAVHDLAVSAIQGNLVQLRPPLPEADLTAGFQMLTEHGAVYGDYSGYTTVYRVLDDGSVILSNDGNVYVEPVPVPIPDPEPVSLEELQAWKQAEVSAACEAAIYSGVDVELSSGMEHFSLTEKDQLNLFGKQAQLAAGADKLEYHQDGHPCRYYSAEDMQKILSAATQHVSYHTTYCNSLNMWIDGAASADEVNTIYYGAGIPEKYQSDVLKDYLARMEGEK